jgi:hypothetical protein
MVLYYTKIHVTDLTASESSEDTADMMILVSMSVTSDSESEVYMPDKNDVASSSFLHNCGNISNSVNTFTLLMVLYYTKIESLYLPASEKKFYREDKFFRVPNWVT